MADDDLHKHRHFVLGIEQAIRETNREVLHPVVNPLTKTKVIGVATEVAKRRADYMYATLGLCNDGGNRPSGDELRRLRLEYEESRDAFAELMRTIERGYVDVPEG